MSRSTYIVNYTDAAETNETIRRIMLEEGYDYVCVNGENVWKGGNGTWTSIKYIKVEFVDAHTLHLTGWIKDTVGGEMNLDGIFCGFPKKQARNVIKKLQAAIR